MLEVENISILISVCELSYNSSMQDQEFKLRNS